MENVKTVTIFVKVPKEKCSVFLHWKHIELSSLMLKTGLKRHLASFTALALLSLFPFISCEKADPVNSKTGNQENKENTENTGQPEGNTAPGKILIVYYSYTGHCDEIVTALSSNLEKADKLRIREVDEDVDYNANNYKLGSDLINAIRKAPGQASSYPAIKDVDKKAGDYDTIIVVTPLWHSQMAAIMQTYLFQNGAAMKGKNIGLVVSSASSGISGVESDAKRLIPDGKFYGTSLWINSANHSKRASLVKEWLEPVSDEQYRSVR